MGAIEIKKISDQRGLKTFIQFYYDLYRGCKQAVPFLYFDEMATLRSDKNPSFECCEVQYFLAERDGKVVGRVDAIINHRANERWNRKQVSFGIGGISPIFSSSVCSTNLPPYRILSASTAALWLKSTSQTLSASIS